MTRLTSTESSGGGKVRFAHVSDLHIGGVTEPGLKRRENQAVQQFVDSCLEEKVEFIVISGDLFDTNIPPMPQAVMVAQEFRRLKESGARIYTIYGSHDFSPTHHSLIEVLEADGLLRVISEPVQDESGVWLNGIHGLAGAKEVSAFRNFSEKLALTGTGNKRSVFAFHTALLEANMVRQEQAIPVSLLPRGYSYYAAGHLHERIEFKSLEGAPVNYPGPLFLGWGAGDLERYFKEGATGFYIVEIDEEGRATFEYKPVRAISGCLLEIGAEGADAREFAAHVSEQLSQTAQKYGRGSLIMLKLTGELRAGRRETVTVAIEKVKKRYPDIDFKVNDRALTDPEEVVVEQGEDLEERAFQKLAKMFPGEVSSDFILKLVESLGTEKQPGESRADYNSRILAEVDQLLSEKLGDSVKT